MAAAIPHVQGGRIRALGVTSTSEAPQLPRVPPIAKTLPGFENAGWFGIVGAGRHAEGDRGEGLRGHAQIAGID